MAPLFRAWLDAHRPLRAAHVMSLVQQMRGGRDYDADFATRMRGNGEFATLIERRFAIAVKRLGLNRNARRWTARNSGRPHHRRRPQSDARADLFD